MARINWHGGAFIAKPIEQLPNSDWLMEAQQHGPRFTIGTKIIVKAKDVIEMAAAETPPDPTAGAAALDQAMADERKTLPSVADLLQQDRVTAQPKDKPDGSQTEEASPQTAPRTNAAEGGDAPGGADARPA